MIFMGLEFMKAEPFREVLIHGLVLDKYGKKMSKSRPETSVDPQDIIDSFGADTLRFTLATGTALGQDQRFQMEKVEGSRNFTNKIWNAARFVLMHYEKVTEGDLIDNLQDTWLRSFATGETDALPPDWLTLPDQWILSRLQRVISETTRSLERILRLVYRTLQIPLKSRRVIGAEDCADDFSPDSSPDLRITASLYAVFDGGDLAEFAAPRRQHYDYGLARGYGILAVCCGGTDHAVGD
jgi:cysteinyl-tRNA synthetase